MNAAFSDHVSYFEGAFEEHKDFYPRLQKEIDWQTIQWRTKPLPRLCRHSVQQFPVGHLIVKWLEAFCSNNLGVNALVHDVFGNYYRDGNDYLPDHHDNYSTNEIAMHVVSISFGVPRRFNFKEGGRVAQGFKLKGGDVIIFDPYMNKNYTHGIAKTPGLNEGRINLTCFVSFDKLPYGKTVQGRIVSASEIAATQLILE